jgi:ubiquinone/menaquinone biosynthesis C-methylase UbiE
MAVSTTEIQEPLPQEMQQHTYAIMRRVEDTHWWFVGRRRILEAFLDQICANLDAEGLRILDVGCGTGANLEMLQHFGTAKGVDVSSEALSFCRGRGLENVRQGEAERLPFADNSFDLVTALDVLEHLDDDSAGLSEFSRVLRPGGYVLMFVPAFMFLWGTQDDVSHHRRRYTLDSLSAAVRESGLVIERITYANIMFFAPILLARVLMRLTGLKPASENNINIGSLNGILGRILGAEGAVLKKTNLPFGVSAICVARRP